MTPSTTPSRTPPASPRAEGALRVAIVGGGKMARHHARAVPRSAVPARVVALAEPDPRAREGFLAACPGPTAFDSLEGLLAGETVDVVHVCTPPPTHETLALAALEAGLPVYVEKPFSETPAQAERILALARERGLPVCAGHQLLFEAPARRALGLLSGLGAIHHVESYFAFRPVRTGAGGTRALRADLQLLDVLPHPVYVLLHFLEAAVPAAETQLTRCELGPGGTLHAFLRRGELTASLIVTLEGRPVESYLHAVGSNGTLHADFVRGTVQHLIGPGTSTVDKTLNPYRLGLQLVGGTTAALAARLLRRQASYPGLAEIFEAFYRAVRGGVAAPVSDASIVGTVAVCERVAKALHQTRTPAPVPRRAGAPRVAITGGTGFLGSELARTLVQQGIAVRILARREAPPWDRIPGVEYVTADLGEAVPEGAMDGVETVVHLAAETAGGFDEHERNSVGAAEHVCRSAAAAGVRRLIHVSSLAVYGATQPGAAIREDTAVEREPRARGPYVWGKVRSEQVVGSIGRELGVAVKIVRPGAILDFERLEPPGRLGRRVGNVFVAVGSPSERLGIVQRRSAAEALAWMTEHFEEAPDALNLLEPILPTKREIVDALRRANPGLRVVWLPHALLRPLSAVAILAQRLLRPGREPIDLAGVFAVDRYDTGEIARLRERIAAGQHSRAATLAARG